MSLENDTSPGRVEPDHQAPPTITQETTTAVKGIYFGGLKVQDDVLAPLYMFSQTDRVFRELRAPAFTKRIRRIVNKHYPGVDNEARPFFRAGMAAVLTTYKIQNSEALTEEIMKIAQRKPASFEKTLTETSPLLDKESLSEADQVRQLFPNEPHLQQMVNNFSSLCFWNMRGDFIKGAAFIHGLLHKDFPREKN